VAVGAASVNACISGLDEALADRLEGYRTHLEGLPLAPATRRAYAGRVDIGCQRPTNERCGTSRWRAYPVFCLLGSTRGATDARSCLRGTS